MWCRVCELETTETVCSVCGYPTIEDNLGSVDNTIVHYCKNCSTPIIFKSNDTLLGKCPICNNKTDYLAKDIRPVFPEEKLLLSILLKRKYEEILNSNVWVSNSRYYINAETVNFPSSIFREADTKDIKVQIENNKNLVERDTESYKVFENQIKTFISANKKRLDFCYNLKRLNFCNTRKL